MVFFILNRGRGGVVDVCQRERGRWGDGTEQPAAVVPCGLSGFHQMNGVITDGDSGWLSVSA